VDQHTPQVEHLPGKADGWQGFIRLLLLLLLLLLVHGCRHG
jgi:hypothetical protein